MDEIGKVARNAGVVKEERERVIRILNTTKEKSPRTYAGVFPHLADTGRSAAVSALESVLEGFTFSGVATSSSRRQVRQQSMLRGISLSDVMCAERNLIPKESNAMVDYTDF